MIRIPRRFIYTPKAFVYTRSTYGTSTGVTYNLTPWVTAGRVDRKINQVSSAEITLRNPYKRFTRPGDPSGGVAFHPMDPITIYLERLPGYPVRVFTGYLDETPYLQLYPGTVTLKASCTLKKLLYTYFDPALPFVIAFLQKYGWEATGAGGLINFGAFGDQGKPGSQQQDSSIGRLLWASLYEMGEWTDANIYVENLPPGITQRVASLMAKMDMTQKVAANEFQVFMQNIVGSGSQGSGGGAGATTNAGNVQGSLTDTQAQIAKNLVAIGEQLKAPPLAIQACLVIGAAENTWNLTTCNSSNHCGLFQLDSTWQAMHDFKDYTYWAKYAYQNGFYSNGGLIQIVNNNPGISVGQAVEDCQGAGQAAVSYYQGFASQALQLYNQYKNSVVGIAIQTGASGVTHATNQAGSTAPASTGTGQYVTPFASGAGQNDTRTDEGVDFGAPGASIPVRAIGNGTVDMYSPSGFGSPGQSPQVIFVYTLSDGDHAGQHIYVNEQMNINPSLQHQGTKVTAGQTIGDMVGGGSIEIGFWDLATGHPAQNTLPGGGAYDDVHPTIGGMEFTNFLRSIGQSTRDGPFPSVGGSSTSGGGTAAGGAGTGTGTTATVNNTAQAFVAEINFPTVADMSAAIMLGTEHKGLMHDQSLMPWIQQLSQASLRSFQSLPDGSFYGFYPDYFGEFGHHDAYWLVDDIELLDGGVNLTDDALATHVFAVGDNLWNPSGGVPELFNQLFSSGAINVFNAFGIPGIIDTTSAGKNQPGSNAGLGNIMNSEEAIQFIKRYGARPIVQNYPMVRSGIFEMLLAYQQFMYAWSNQFRTPFKFTFMPEIFPGGKIGFPNHGLKMYVNSVTHTWNYQEGGFTTDAELSAPSLLNPKEDPAKYGLPPNMVEALIEPIRQPGAPTLTSAQEKQLKQTTQHTVATIDQQAQNIAKYIATF